MLHSVQRWNLTKSFANFHCVCVDNEVQWLIYDFSLFLLINYRNFNLGGNDSKSKHPIYTRNFITVKPPQLGHFSHPFNESEEISRKHLTQIDHLYRWMWNNSNSFRKRLRDSLNQRRHFAFISLSDIIRISICGKLFWFKTFFIVSH